MVLSSPELHHDETSPGTILEAYSGIPLPSIRPGRVSTMMPTIESSFARLRSQLSQLPNVALALAILVAALLSRPAPPTGTIQAFHWAITALCVILATFRNAVPLVSVVGFAVAGAAHVLATHKLSLLTIALALSVAYGSQTQVKSSWRWLSLVALLVGTTVTILLIAKDSALESWLDPLIATTMAWSLIIAAALAGLLRQRNREQFDMAIERAELLEEQRRVEQRLNTIEERANMAREIHDVLGHSLSVVAVQAEGARYILESDPNGADRLLQDIGNVSREAVSEVSRVTRLLRGPTGQSAQLVDKPPPPQLSDLEGFVSSVRSTNPSVELQILGNIDDVPAQISGAAYRIVQESCVNALKHAPGGSVTIRVQIEASRIMLHICNTAGSAVRERTTVGTGTGIVGMKETALAFDGTLTAGADATTGEWHVKSELFWSRS
ncbi:hypothetical protein HMPREF3162_04355 [Brevibacterium sp. HMSC07C04]|nr:hypothetical protein HMPREF3162_04355 [Brevibacterium sp. HMSC07C04]